MKSYYLCSSHTLSLPQSHILFILGISWRIKLMPEEVYPPNEDNCLQKQAGTAEEAFFRLDRVAA